MLRKSVVGSYLWLFLAMGLIASCGAGGGGSSTTSGGSDSTAPTVLAVVPVNGSTIVSVFTSISASFSKTMDLSTISAATFTVNPVTAGTITYDVATRTAKFIPASPLAGTTVYTATLSSSVKDLSGNAMAGPVSWSFTTQYPVYNISGTVTSSPGVGIPCVTLTLASAGSGTMSQSVTDANGHYIIYSLPNGDYTVTPTRNNYSFSGTTAVNVNYADAAKNFTATYASALITYSISGAVTNNLAGGAVMPGVSIYLSGPDCTSAISDGSGNYALNGLIDGTYLVTVPSSTPGFAFWPPSKIILVSGASVTNNNIVWDTSGTAH